VTHFPIDHPARARIRPSERNASPASPPGPDQAPSPDIEEAWAANPHGPRPVRREPARAATGLICHFREKGVRRASAAAGRRARAFTRCPQYVQRGPRSSVTIVGVSSRCWRTCPRRRTRCRVLANSRAHAITLHAQSFAVDTLFAATKANSLNEACGPRHSCLSCECVDGIPTARAVLHG